MELRPITRAEADAFIRANHRHHDAPVGALWRQAVHDDAGRLVGVAVVGRPVARALDDGLTVEVTRLCTDGSANACSLLYAATRRAAIAKGYRRGLTYILASERGSTLRASGWDHLWDVKGRSWDCPSRPRTDKHPTEDKQAWGWGSWPPQRVVAKEQVCDTPHYCISVQRCTAMDAQRAAQAAAKEGAQHGETTRR